ncbi:MAG: HigA family addiction module antidote protein [Rhodospirillales bacterium]|nr:HigA family addiction module antidote protein [Rhodospirillales bacterium]
MLVPIHPGEVLEAEFLEPLGLSARSLARSLGVPANRISDLVRARRGMTGDTALRLARYFGTTPELWLNLQARYELDLARDRAGDEIERITPRAA